MERHGTLSDHRWMYWLYYIAGGVYTSAEVSKRVKYSSFAVHLTIMFVMVVGSIGYCVTAESSEMNLLNQSIGLSTALTGFFVLTFFPALTTYYHRNIRVIFGFIERQKNEAADRLRTLKQSAYLSAERFQKVRGISFWPKLLFTFISLYYCIPPFNLILFNFDQTGTFGQLEYHLFGIPYGDRISSLSLYWAVYSTEVLSNILVVIGTYSAPLLFLAIANQLNNVILLYSQEVENLSQLIAEPSPSPHLLYIFSMKLKILIWKYGLFIRSVRQIRSYFEIISSMLIPTLFTFLLCQTFVLLATDAEANLHVRLFGATILCQLYVYMICEFGSILSDMQEEIIQTVSSLPWYHLPPGQRKTLYIFLTQMFRLAYSYGGVLAATLK